MKVGTPKPSSVGNSVSRVIATPVSTHFDLANRALQEGKHVLVTKPLASSSEQAQQLIEQSAGKNRVLMVDHTFIYTGAVKKIKELVLFSISEDYFGVRARLGTTIG